MSNFIKKHHKILLYLLFTVSIIYILIYMRPSAINFDENYTLALINHNLNQVIYLDSLDVHPPLYYLILKMFINIFTFWTDYLPIKIIFARLLSVIISIISFIYLSKISKNLNIKINTIIMWIAFVSLPITLGITFPFQQMTNIRMYALAGLFIIIEFYYLLRFRINQKNINLIISIIFAVLSFYTHYYAAIFAGLLLIDYFIKYILDHNIKSSIKLFMSGIIVILFYIPWIKPLFQQISNPTTYWLTSTSLIKQSLMFLILILIFIYPFFYYYRNFDNYILNEQIVIILSVLFMTFVFSFFYSIINHPMFLLRYMYPMLIIYEFIGIIITIKIINNNKLSKYRLTYFCLIFFMLLINTGGSFIYQSVNYIPSSIKSVNNYLIWDKSKNKNIYINKNSVPNNYDDIGYNLLNLIYLKNKKNLFVYKSFIQKDYDNKNNLYNKVFNNINNNINIYPY